MSYINAFEEQLANKIASGEDKDAIVRWVSNKILESFKNGVAYGRNGKRERKALPSPSDIPTVPQA